MDPASAIDAIRQVIPGVAETARSRLSLLGSPLDEGGLDHAISDCGRKVELVCDRVQHLDSHWALFFLTRFSAAPRLNYLMRSSPAYLQPAELVKIDEMVRNTLAKCTNVDVSGDAWAQASLPLRHGGLGVRKVSDLALPCYLASLHATRELTATILPPSSTVGQDTTGPLPAAVAEFQRRLPDATVPEADAAKRQRHWDDISCDSIVSSLLAPANQVDRARLLAAKQPHSGAWLSATPAAKVGLHLDDATVRVAVALRLGATVCEPHSCRCGSRVDKLGHHGLACQYSAGRLPRHANINDVVKRGLVAAGIPALLEPVGLDRGDGKRPDGATVFPYFQGKCLVWDATCTDTFCNSQVVQAAIEPGSAAAAKERLKRDKYSALTDRYLFEPVAVETTGVLGPSSKVFLHRLGKRITARTGNKRETSWLFERISLAVVRGNSASVNATGCFAG